MRVALAGAFLALALGAHAAPVAFVADIRGNATIEGNGRLMFLAELPEGTRILLGSGGVVSITYATTGAEFTINGPGEFLVGGSEVKAEMGAAPKRRTVTTLVDPAVVGRAAQSATASLRMRGLAGNSAPAARLEYPVATRIATLQPTLRWRSVPGEDELTVALRDAGGRELWKGRARTGGAQPPVKLSPATRYSWTVMTGRGAVGEAHFETLPAEAISRVEKANTAPGGFPGRVLLALLLQDLGAQQEAREAWAALARERPDLPELAALAR